MKALIKKEFKLALHPTVPLFWLLSAMLIIPNYPYYVAFFYTTLGLFFVCLTGRENRDIQYSMMLPVAKRDIVRGRFIFTLIVECVQVIAAIPFAVLRARLDTPDPQFMTEKLCVLAIGIIAYAALTWAGYRISVRRFEHLDI